MMSGVLLLLPVLVPTVCGILTGVIPAFRDDKTRRIPVLFVLAATLGVTLWQALAWRSPWAPMT